jgi:lysozyme
MRWIADLFRFLFGNRGGRGDTAAQSVEEALDIAFAEAVEEIEAEPVEGEGAYAYTMPEIVVTADRLPPVTFPPTRVSQQAIELKKEFEGFERVISGRRVHAYLCPAGVWTIGFGNTGADPFNGGVIGPNTIWTFEQAETAFKRHLEQDERHVLRLTTIATNQNQFDALVCLCYNIGPANLARSTLLRMHNAGNFAGAADQFIRWNKAGGRVLRGLTRRREAEARMYQGKDWRA